MTANYAARPGPSTATFQIADASDDGIAAIHGDGTRADVLRRADIEHARKVIVAVPKDDAAVLVTLTVRRHNPSAYVVAAVRESENAPLLRGVEVFRAGSTGGLVSIELIYHRRRLRPPSPVVPGQRGERTELRSDSLLLAPRGGGRGDGW